MRDARGVEGGVWGGAREAEGPNGKREAARASAEMQNEWSSTEESCSSSRNAAAAALARRPLMTAWLLPKILASAARSSLE